MQRRILWLVALMGTIAFVAGCGSGMLGSWGELGDEVSAGPYRLQIPKRFKRDDRTPQIPGETKIIFRGPALGNSGPGILLSFGRHHQNFSQQSPNWNEGVRRGLSGLRAKSQDFSQEIGAPTTINGLPAVRVQFKGKLQEKGKSHAMEGVGYLVIDNEYLAFVLGMNFGSGAKASLPKLENAIRTIRRPGASGGPPAAVHQAPIAQNIGPQIPSGPNIPSHAGPPSHRMGNGAGTRPTDMAGPPNPFPHQVGTGPSNHLPATYNRNTSANADYERQTAAASRTAELETTASTAGDPDYFAANLELLRTGNQGHKAEVINRLSGVHPNEITDPEQRKSLARAIKDVAEDTTVPLDVRREALAVTVDWTDYHSVPILIGLLNDPQRLMQMDALELLTRFNDPDAIGPVVELFVSNAPLRGEAADYLREFGSAAEDKILELVTPNELTLTRATVQLLGDIGTENSIIPLGKLRQRPFYNLIKRDTNLALSKIRRRAKEKE